MLAAELAAVQVAAALAAAVAADLHMVVVQIPAAGTVGLETAAAG